MLGVNERLGLKLFGREIIFEEFQPVWSRYLNVTDGQTRRTDGRHICNPKTSKLLQENLVFFCPVVELEKSSCYIIRFVALFR